MDETKSAIKSKGLLGSVATILAALFLMWDIETDAAQIEEWLVAGAAFVGGVLAFWGRLTATEKIDRAV